MIVRVYIYILPFTTRANVGADLGKVLNYATSFLPFLRGDVERQRGRAIELYE